MLCLCCYLLSSKFRFVQPARERESPFLRGKEIRPPFGRRERNSFLKGKESGHTFGRINPISDWTVNDLWSFFGRSWQLPPPKIFCCLNTTRRDFLLFLIRARREYSPGAEKFTIFCRVPHSFVWQRRSSNSCPSVPVFFPCNWTRLSLGRIRVTSFFFDKVCDKPGLFAAKQDSSRLTAFLFREWIPSRVVAARRKTRTKIHTFLYAPHGKTQTIGYGMGKITPQVFTFLEAAQTKRRRKKTYFLSVFDTFFTSFSYDFCRGSSFSLTATKCRELGQDVGAIEPGIFYCERNSPVGFLDVVEAYISCR